MASLGDIDGKVSVLVEEKQNKTIKRHPEEQREYEGLALADSRKDVYADAKAI